ncbi:venom allergen 3 [Megachile rotundata]|uniref:venom allergen 3 n=1 Tax=Megachile rotundata TaxID=143995 RepID=UPI000258F74C|nr:PREDICTED: venom allergen 3-like [Megachile rotundata]
MLKFLCFVAVTAFTIVVTSAIDCGNNMCTARGTQHTLCLYPNNKPAAACGRVISVGFTDSEKQEIVHAHNYYRARVMKGEEKRGNPGPQPPASNMQKMVWDNEIANIAQRWANQCKFGHDSCRNVARFYVGQNAAMTSTTGTVTTKPTNIVEMWYNEVKVMDRNQVPRFTGKDLSNVGHYTQLVWAKSNRLGCGKIIYQTDAWKHYYVVCNYGPGGNVLTQPIYDIKK